MRHASVHGSYFSRSLLCAGGRFAPIHTSIGPIPMPGTAYAGISVAFFLAVTGIAIAFRRTGIRAVMLIPALIVGTISGAASLAYLHGPYEGEHATIFAVGGLLVSSILVAFWYKSTVHVGVSATWTCYVLTFAAILTALSLVTFKLSIIGWRNFV